MSPLGQSAPLYLQWGLVALLLLVVLVLASMAVLLVAGRRLLVRRDERTGSTVLAPAAVASAPLPPDAGRRAIWVLALLPVLLVLVLCTTCGLIALPRNLALP